MSFDFPLAQAIADHQLPCFIRRLFAKADRALAHYGQTKQGATLMHHDLALTFAPVRIAMVVLNQLAANRLDPFRLNLGHRSGKQLAGLGQLGGDYPLRASLGLAPGVQLKACVPATTIILLVSQPDTADKTRQDCLMHAAIVTGFVV